MLLLIPFAPSLDSAEIPFFFFFLFYIFLLSWFKPQAVICVFHFGKPNCKTCFLLVFFNLISCQYRVPFKSLTDWRPQRIINQTLDPQKRSTVFVTLKFFLLKVAIVIEKPCDRYLMAEFWCSIFWVSVKWILSDMPFWGSRQICTNSGPINFSSIFLKAQKERDIIYGRTTKRTCHALHILNVLFILIWYRKKVLTNLRFPSS